MCGPDLGRDDVVAARSQAVAVVEAVENTRYWEDGGSACLTARVKTLEALKGEFGNVLDVTQGVKNGGSPGRYAMKDPDRYAVLEPGRQYVIAVQSGSPTGTAGSEAWAWYAEPAWRGSGSTGRRRSPVRPRRPPAARVRTSTYRRPQGLPQRFPNRQEAPSGSRPSTARSLRTRDGRRAGSVVAFCLLGGRPQSLALRSTGPAGADFVPLPVHRPPRWGGSWMHSTRRADRRCPRAGLPLPCKRARAHQQAVQAPRVSGVGADDIGREPWCHHAIRDPPGGRAPGGAERSPSHPLNRMAHRGGPLPA